MAIDVNTVYKTVLLIINKEQRGYLTPEEFNRTAAQVQLEIFNEYFEDLNQQLRVPGNDSEYANRIENIEEKISIFESNGDCAYDSTPGSLTINTFGYPIIASPNSLYKLGTVIYNNEKVIQNVAPNELIELNLSPLTKPSTYWPVYQLKNSRITVYPKTIMANVSCTYLRRPLDPVWGFTIGTRGQYIYNPSAYNPASIPTVGSRNFELHIAEQPRVILKILLYAGVIIKDPQIVQTAIQQVQAETVNSKS